MAIPGKFTGTLQIHLADGNAIEYSLDGVNAPADVKDLPAYVVEQAKKKITAISAKARSVSGVVYYTNPVDNKVTTFKFNQDLTKQGFLHTVQYALNELLGLLEAPIEKAVAPIIAEAEHAISEVVGKVIGKKKS